MTEAEKGTISLTALKEAVYRNVSRLLADMQGEFAAHAGTAGGSKSDAVTLFIEVKRSALQKLLKQCS